VKPNSSKPTSPKPTSAKPRPKPARKRTTPPTKPSPTTAKDRRTVSALCQWFGLAARPLPWRLTPRQPYPSLVSEFMLQQTQVSRVLEKFAPFMLRFPTLPALAAAPDSDVLGLWSGLGYYRRARNLHAAARDIVQHHRGQVPATIADLTSLPGIGRYTAGAIASIVFGHPEPIVDGNVARVLLRLEGKELSQTDGMAWAWTRAAALVVLTNAPKAKPAGSAPLGPGPFNEALMELGATVCTPRAPRCTACPLHRDCAAFKEGTQEDIPRPKTRITRTPLYCASVLAHDSACRLLVEQRSTTGMWAGLWQAPTLESSSSPPSRRAIESWLNAPVERLARFTHTTTHRDVTFDIWRATGPVHKPGTQWLPPKTVSTLGLSNPMRRILLNTPGNPHPRLTKPRA